MAKRLREATRPTLAAPELDQVVARARGSPLSACSSAPGSRPGRGRRRRRSGRLRRGRRAATAPGALPSSVVRVDRPLAGDDEVAGRARSRKPRVEHELRARHQLGAERGERGAEPAGRAGAGQVGDGRSSSRAASRASSSSTCFGRSALLRPEDARGASQPSVVATSQATRVGTGKRVEHLEQAGARRPSSPCRRGRRASQPAAPERGADQLAEPAARRRAARRARPGRAGSSPSAASTTRCPVGEHAASARHAAGRTRRTPLASCHEPPEQPSTSAVPSPPSATGIASASAPARREPLGQRGRRVGRAEDALEASRARERASRAASRRSDRRLLASGHSRLGHLGHLAQHREREPLAAEEDQPDADADRRLDRLQPDPERERPSRRARRTGRAAARSPPGRARRSRARAGRSSRRSSAPARGRPPAAARGCRTPRIAVQTAKSWQSQPRHWKKIAPSRRAAARASRRARSAPSSRRACSEPASSSTERWCRRALTKANRKRTDADATRPRSGS